MAAWGYYNFDNDDATNFAGEFLDTGSEVTLLEALVPVAEAEGYLEAPEASAALAAAEIVAAWRGHPGPDFLPGLLDKVRHLDVSDEDELTDLARRAVQAVVRESAVRALWEDQDLIAWEAAQQNLLDRLAREPVE